MQNAHCFLARELTRPIRVRDQHDHLRDPSSGLGDLQELDRQLWRRDDFKPKTIAIELKRRLHIAHPQNNFGESCDACHAATAATAETIASRLASRTRGGNEQPGASNSPR